MKNVSESNEAEVLYKAFQSAWSNLTPSDSPSNSIPSIFDSKEMKLYFIEAYKALYSKAGGDSEFMRHWFNSFNKELDGMPLSLCSTEAGVMSIRDYFKTSYHL